MKPGEPFSAIVQKASLCLTRLLSIANGRMRMMKVMSDERNETSDQRYFLFLARTRATLLHRATPPLCPDTNRTLATARPVCTRTFLQGPPLANRLRLPHGNSASKLIFIDWTQKSLVNRRVISLDTAP